MKQSVRGFGRVETLKVVDCTGEHKLSQSNISNNGFVNLYKLL